jgi:hypothetical protein
MTRVNMSARRRLTGPWTDDTGVTYPVDRRQWIRFGILLLIPCGCAAALLYFVGVL